MLSPASALPINMSPTASNSISPGAVRLPRNRSPPLSAKIDPPTTRSPLMSELLVISETAPLPELIDPTLIETPANRLVLPVLRIVPMPIVDPASTSIRPLPTTLPVLTKSAASRSIPPPPRILPISISPLCASSTMLASPVTLPIWIAPGAMMVSVSTLSRCAVVMKLLPVVISKARAKKVPAATVGVPYWTSGTKSAASQVIVSAVRSPLSRNSDRLPLVTKLNSPSTTTSPLITEIESTPEFDAFVPVWTRKSSDPMLPSALRKTTPLPPRF